MVSCKFVGGRTWHVVETFTVETRYGKVTVKHCFFHDRYTFAPNLTEELPAIVHDWLRQERKFDDGSSCTLRQSDIVLRDLIVRYNAKLVLGWITISSRRVAPIYYFFVRCASIWGGLFNG